MKARYTHNVVKTDEKLFIRLTPIFGTERLRKKKEKVSSPKQKNLNDSRARQFLEQKIYANFRTGVDYWAHFTYDEAVYTPESFEEAERFFLAFIRRINRTLSKRGKSPIKMIYTTEQGYAGLRWHHHAIVSADLSRDELEAMWTYGRGKNKQKLGRGGVMYLAETEERYKKTANYIIKECKDGKKRWRQTGPLKNPVSRNNVYVNNLRTIEKAKKEGLLYERAFWESRKEYKGYFLQEIEEIFSDENALGYFYIVMKRKC